MKSFDVVLVGGTRRPTTARRAVSQVLIRTMAKVIITMKVMPESPDIDLEGLQSASEQKISDWGGEVGKVLIEPVAFGLKAVVIMFIMDESKGGTDPLEEQISGITGVQSVQVTDVRRTIG